MQRVDVLVRGAIYRHVHTYETCPCCTPLKSLCHRAVDPCDWTCGCHDACCCDACCPRCACVHHCRGPGPVLYPCPLRPYNKSHILATTKADCWGTWCHNSSLYAQISLRATAWTPAGSLAAHAVRLSASFKAGSSVAHLWNFCTTLNRQSCNLDGASAPLTAIKAGWYPVLRGTLRTEQA